MAEKTVVKALRLRPEIASEVQRLADVNGISFVAMTNLLLMQALKKPTLLTK